MAGMSAMVAHGKPNQPPITRDMSYIGKQLLLTGL